MECPKVWNVQRVKPRRAGRPGGGDEMEVVVNGAAAHTAAEAPKTAMDVPSSTPKGSVHISHGAGQFRRAGCSGSQRPL